MWGRGGKRERGGCAGGLGLLRGEAKKGDRKTAFLNLERGRRKSSSYEIFPVRIEKERRLSSSPFSFADVGGRGGRGTSLSLSSFPLREKAGKPIIFSQFLTKKKGKENGVERGAGPDFPNSIKGKKTEKAA